MFNPYKKLHSSLIFVVNTFANASALLHSDGIQADPSYLPLAVDSANDKHTSLLLISAANTKWGQGHSIGFVHFRCYQKIECQS